MHDEVFVPETSLADVDTRWEELCEQKPEYFDGEILHVIHVNATGCGGAILQVARSSYRFHAVGDLGIKPLGCKGICKQGDNYLCGLRGKQMAVYPNLWEFAPAGMVEPTQTPQNVIERELEEETGLMLTSTPLAIAIFFDENASTWEIVFQLAVQGDCTPDGTEYESLDWFTRSSLPSPMSPSSKQMKTLL
jgi:ADP-ribose pyrophosphatase YjhB (NUDIX family)